MRNEICGLGRAQPPPLVVLLFLEFQSIGNESPIALLWEEGVGRAHLPSASIPYLTPCSFILFIKKYIFNLFIWLLQVLVAALGIFSGSILDLVP